MTSKRLDDGQDVFAHIHAHFRANRLKTVIKLIVDRAGRLRPEFRVDANHAWYCVGDAYFRLGDYPSARDGFSKALRSQPDDIDALVAIANCYDALSKPRYAAHYLWRAINEARLQRIPSQEFSKVAFNLGNALSDLGRYGEAVDVYRQIKSGSRDLLRAAARNRDLAANCG
jgi:tetratricopeptide (TPR) repeat protein